MQFTTIHFIRMLGRLPSTGEEVGVVPSGSHDEPFTLAGVGRAQRPPSYALATADQARRTRERMRASRRHESPRVARRSENSDLWHGTGKRLFTFLHIYRTDEFAPWIRDNVGELAVSSADRRIRDRYGRPRSMRHRRALEACAAWPTLNRVHKELFDAYATHLQNIHAVMSEVSLRFLSPSPPVPQVAPSWGET